jgi:hypothetical protein
VFADESARGRRYYIGAACIAQHDLKAVRQLARSLCLPGQRRWHFTKEKDSRRAQIIGALTRSGLVTAWVGLGKGDEVSVRALCMQRLGFELVGWSAERLVIESREGRDEQDRRALFRVLREHPAVHYEHQTPNTEPGLWIADAIAWCYGAGGLWRKRVTPMITGVHDVGQA